jgi:hypothetical protein
MVIGCGGSTPEVFTGVVVMAAMDLWWGGGGCDGSVMGIVVVAVVVTDLIGGFSGVWWWGAHAGVGYGIVGVRLMPCVIGFFRYRILWPRSNLLRFAWLFFESLMVFRSAEICRFLGIWLAFFRVGVDCLEVDYMLRLICLDFQSTTCHYFWLTELFWDSDGPFNFDSRAGVRV